MLAFFEVQHRRSTRGPLQSPVTLRYRHAGRAALLAFGVMFWGFNRSSVATITVDLQLVFGERKGQVALTFRLGCVVGFSIELPFADRKRCLLNTAVQDFVHA